MKSSLESVIACFEMNFEKHLEDLKELVRIPSVSFSGFSKEEVVHSAEKTADLLKKSGLEHVKMLTIDDANPYVYGDWLKKEGAPTLLLYAHHDVQPPMREEVWKTQPFEPVIRDGRLYGRGAADDKAGIVVHTAAIASYLTAMKELPVNIKVIIEGEEEIGSKHLSAFVREYHSLLQSDVVIITDVANFDTGVPSLTTALRGLVAVEIEVTALKSPLHSGMWGGALPDPIMALSKILSGLVDDNGMITIHGIYDDIRPLTKDEKESFQALSTMLPDSEFRKQTGLIKQAKLIGGNASTLEKMWRLPSLVVNSIESGGKKIAGNVIMDKAWARVGIRIVPDMDPNTVLELLTKKIHSLNIWNLSVDVKADSLAKAWTTACDHPVFALAKKSMTRGYNNDAMFIGCGGSIPFVDTLTQAMGNIPALLMGIEDPYTNAHSENESLHLGDFKKAILSEVYFFEALSHWDVQKK